jgi:hypothetical protein
MIILAITAGTAAVKATYTNAIATSFDILKPEVWSKMMKSHGNQNAEYFSVISSLGFKVASANETYRHYEDDWIHETVKVTTPITDSAGIGLLAKFTIHADSIDASNRFYIREKDILISQAGNRMYVTDITGTLVTVVPTEATVQLTKANLDFNDLDELSIISNASDEATNQPEGRFSGTRKYTNDLQIIKESLKVTGTQMTDGLWFQEITYAGANGKPISAYYTKGQEDAEYRMALAMEGACLFGKKNTNTVNLLDPESSAALKMTEGTYSYIEANGNTVNYTPGSFTVSKFNEINKIADKEVAPENYCAFLGIDIHDEFDDTFVDYNKDTNISFTKEVTGGKKAIEIGFDFLKKSGRKYGFKRLQSFSNAKTYGAPGYNYSSQAMFIPMGMNKALDANQVSQKLPTVGMRYKKLGSYNRFMEVWDVSGAGEGRKVTENDSKNLYLRSHIGSHNMVGNQMILLKP